MGWLILSFVLVAFGQPSWIAPFGLLASIFGYACFFKVILGISSPKQRFLVGLTWYTIVQLVQFSWVFFHPFYYIYGVVLLVSLLFGLQWGVFSLFIRQGQIEKISSILALAGYWTLLEWTRHFIFSGLPFNPAGLLLSGSLWSLQFASIAGVYGLTFWILLTNLFFLRAWIHRFSLRNTVTVLVLAIFPYFFGGIHYEWHKKGIENSETINVVLIQPDVPVEEQPPFQSAEEAREHVLGEWSHLLELLKKHEGKKIDLIVFPEYVVPYGTFYPIFPFERIQEIFSAIYGENGVLILSKKSPYSDTVLTDKGKRLLVSNAYIAQSIADLFGAHLVLGLEDRVYVDDTMKKSESYSSAFHFPPFISSPSRYEKRILVPMGEYIPFEFCRTLAARYGIQGSFTCGREAKVFEGPVRMSPLICYEEIFGDLVREGRLQQAELLVNLTNDGWFLGAQLPEQHFAHARLRTVENGIPLVRACNTGLTCGVDSLGRVISSLGTQKITAGSLFLKLPLYHYRTFYSYFGDRFVLFLSVIVCVFGLFEWYRVRKDNE